MKRTLLTASMMSIILLSSCNKSLSITDRGISHETKFGGVYIDMTIEDFNNLGFSFGDSLEVTYSNGYTLSDLPYYNGYYVDSLSPLMVGYPGYPFIKTCFNNGPDMWEVGDLKEDDKVSITLKEKGKYLAIQEAMDIHYTDEQGDMPDEVFANFRKVETSALKDGILYRSASPVDNQHNRAPITDRLIKDKVNAIINLSDNDDEVKEHIAKEDFNSPYFLSVYEKNNVIALAMNTRFQSSLNEVEEEVPSLFTGFKDEAFSAKLIRGLEFMVSREGPYLVHCVEGKDRTGFVCMVLEALAGSSYQEMIDDYMITYDNYYGINLESDPSKYNIIKTKNIDLMLSTVIGDPSVDIKTADYERYTTDYLLEKGMSRDNIDSLKSILKK
ncbi:MAG: tyrosine-protein phosphatase [Bacilli bacterium]|nr:tyrosine-protein phosphatase [Bacilli bacterium]